MEKVSEKLAALVASRPGATRVRLNVMVRRGLQPARLESLAKAIARPEAREAPEHLPISGMLSLESSLDDVARIASEKDVEWVDVEAVAPIEQLLD